MTKAILIAQRLLWQNRWLFGILMLWPFVMAALLCYGGRPDPDDVSWMLHQECFAGLALVTVTASTLLGNEQRSRRIVMVLARAVSRPQYLLALLLTSWLPLILYAVGFVIAGAYMTALLGSPSRGVLLMAAAQLILGLWAGAMSIFWSILLPQIVASIVSAACLGIAAFVGTLGEIGPGRLLIELFELPLTGRNLPATFALDLLLTLLVAAVWFAAASWLFARRDLNLVTD